MTKEITGSGEYEVFMPTNKNEKTTAITTETWPDNQAAKSTVNQNYSPAIDEIISVIGMIGIIFLFYILIKYLIKSQSQKFKYILMIIVWIVLFVFLGITYYANHYISNGNWADIFRNYIWLILLGILLLTGIALSIYSSNRKA